MTTKYQRGGLSLEIEHQPGVGYQATIQTIGRMVCDTRPTAREAVIAALASHGDVDSFGVGVVVPTPNRDWAISCADRHR